MINISELITDPDFSQKIEFCTVTNSISADMTDIECTKLCKIVDCVIQPAGEAQLQLLSEGERTRKPVLIHLKEIISTGDLFTYRNTNYRVTSVTEYADYGYCECIATEYKGVEKTDC